jgi:phasin family protein
MLHRNKSLDASAKGLYIARYCIVQRSKGLRRDNQSEGNMVKSTTTFFDPEFIKAPDFGQWQAEFNRYFADFGKLWANGKASNIDVNWLLAYQRKNIEALTTAHQRAVEGAQAVAKRQVELARAAAEDMSRATRELVAAGSVEDKLTKQTETAKDAFQAAVDSVNELAELIQKSQSQTFEVIRKRVVDNFDEVKAAFEPKATPTKKAA